MSTTNECAAERLPPQDPRSPAGRTANRLVAALALACLSGVLLNLAANPYDIWPLAFVGLVPMVIAQYRLLTRRTCWIAPSVTGFLFFLGVFGETFFATALWFALLACAIVAVIAGLAGLLDRYLAERTGFATFIFFVPAVWAGLDAGRANLELWATNGNLIYSVTDFTWFIQPVGILGEAALELLMLMINYAVALCVLKALTRGRRSASISPSQTIVACTSIGVGLALVVWSVVGVVTLNDVRANLGPMVRVAAIQPGSMFAGSGGLGGTAAGLREMHGKLKEMTAQAAAGGAQLVVWPELALLFDPADASPEEKAWLDEIVGSNNVYLVTGFARGIDPERPLTAELTQPHTNQAALVAPAGDVVGTYTKTRHAPFDDDEFPTGSSYPAFETPLGKIGIMICRDYDFMDPARFDTTSGAQLLAVPAWQFAELGDHREWDALVYRAVENRVSAVSADYAWTSAIIDATGEVQASAGSAATEGRSELLIADVHLGPRKSAFMWYGNWTGWVLLTAIVMFLGLAVALSGISNSWRRRDPGARD